MIDPPLCISYKNTNLVAVFLYDRSGAETAKAASSKRCCPCDLTIAASKRWKIKVRYGCTVTNRRFRLFSLFGCKKAGSALSRLQPAGFPLLLACEASEIVNLLMPAGVRDDLAHKAKMLDSHVKATRMSQAESGMRQAVDV
ncbi:hypothetical protein QTN93_00890 [Sphingomonas aerolata]|uniref:hypothetical protein n=1 Tax=Sphingomonas aerolata TaxID=185951 RepID=UPI0035A6DDF8